MNAQTVLLYGQSLLLSGVAADLAEVPEVRVERASTWADAGQRLLEHTPDLLIFDLTGTNESYILPLLLKDPHPVMLGLDTEHNQAVLLSGRAAQSLTLDQIRQIAAGQRQPRGRGTMGRRRQAYRRAE